MSKFLISLFILVGFSTTAMSQVVATVGSKKITLKEFKRKFRAAQEQLNPPTARQFLEDLVRYEVGLMEARKKASSEKFVGGNWHR